MCTTGIVYHTVNFENWQICDDITSGRVDAHPELLFRFLLLTFVDLKKHTFIYWYYPWLFYVYRRVRFAFPALQPPSPFLATASAVNITTIFSPSQVNLSSALDDFMQTVNLTLWGLSCIKRRCSFTISMPSAVVFGTRYKAAVCNCCDFRLLLMVITFRSVN